MRRSLTNRGELLVVQNKNSTKKKILMIARRATQCGSKIAAHFQSFVTSTLSAGITHKLFLNIFRNVAYVRGTVLSWA